MAHTPDIPERFVCQNCHAIFAGTPEELEERTDFLAPTTCSACGNSEFVSIEQFTRSQKSRDV